MTLLLLLVLCCCYASCTACRQARKIWGSKYALFVDDDGEVILDPQFATGSEPPLQAGDRIERLDGKPLSCAGRPRGRCFYELLQQYQVGDTVDVLLADGRHKTCTIRAIERSEFWIFGVAFGLAGIIMVWSGVLVAWLAGRRVAAGSYAVICLMLYIFGVSLLDYLTWGEITYLFFLGWLAAILGPAWLVLTFPIPPDRLRPRLRPMMISLIALWLVGAWLLYTREEAHRFHGHLVSLQIATLILVTVGFLARRFRADEQRRHELLSSFLGFLGLPVIGILLYSARPDAGWIKLLLLCAIPLLSLLFPVATAYWLIRHNLLQIKQITTRLVFHVPALLVAAMLAGTPVFLRQLLDKWGADSRWLDDACGGLIFVLGAAALQKLIPLLYSPASRAFRPSIVQLSEVLAKSPDPGDGRAVVANVFHCFLPNVTVEVRTEDDFLSSGCFAADDAQALRGGRPVWTRETMARLAVPMRCRGELRGILLARGGVYNDDDLRLLVSVANLGAALFDRAEIAKGKERRVVSAVQQHERSALAVLVSLISHEMGSPLEFFKLILRRLRDGRELTEEYLDALAQSIARLDRHLSWLRQMQAPVPKHEPVSVRACAELACSVNAPLLEARGLCPRLDIDDGLTVQADQEMLFGMIGNLLRNAAQAVARGGALGIEVQEEASRLRIVVWDDGPGAPEEQVPSLFQEQIHSTKPGGTGLGLMVCRNHASALGWSLAYRRAEGRTCFLIEIPMDPAAQAHKEKK
jgi:signal transduction histidine kinase